MNQHNFSEASKDLQQLNSSRHVPAKTETSFMLNKTVFNDTLKYAKFIPDIPESCCFNDENFLSDSFSVDGFVKRNSRRVNSLEKLKEDLNTYLKILKHSMVELINEDYTEFINLSSNLVSFEKSIGNIKNPVIKFQQETSQVQSRLDDVIGLLNSKQKRLHQIRENKLKLNLIQEIIQNLDRIEKNVDAFVCESQQNRPISKMVFLLLDQNSVLISQLSVNFEYLLENVSFGEKSANSLLSNLKNRFDSVSKKYYDILEEQIVHLLTYNLTELKTESDLFDIISMIKQIFRIYLLNDNQKMLEHIIKNNIVRPYFDKFICDSFITKNGAQCMFNKVIEMIDTKCVLLLKVLTETKSDNFDTLKLSSLGYQLITATIWDELVHYCSVRASSLFSLANVDVFQNNYFVTFRFIEEFICKVCLFEHQTEFRQLNSYHLLKSKFNLNVFFHMKLQQIVPTLEKSFTELRFSYNTKSDSFKLNITCLVYDHLCWCWLDNKEQMITCDMFSYLWKLTLKIFIRFSTWIQTASIENINSYIQQTNSNSNESSQNKQQINQIVGALIYDSRMMILNFTSLYKTKICPQWIANYNKLISSRHTTKITFNENSLDEHFDEIIVNFHSSAIKKLFKLLQTEILLDCKNTLDFVNDIPRLYRRTNKEKPSKASGYIFKCVQQLVDYFAIIVFDNTDEWVNEWIIIVFSDLIKHFKNSTLEVLTSVQKTEDSLKKLKKVKPNAGFLGKKSNSMSDDDKIRLQIYLDVMELGNEVSSLTFFLNIGFANTFCL